MAAVVNWYLLLLAIGTAILVKLLHSYSDLFCSLVVKTCFPHTGASANLREEISSIKGAIDAIDMTDEFAKYARLQRQLKEKERELNTRETQSNRKTLFLRTIVRIVVFILIEGIRIYVIVHYRYTPVMTMDSDRLWPLANIVSYPIKIPGAVSPTVLIIASRQAITSTMNFLPNKVKVKRL